MLEQTLTIQNKLGLHVRTASRFVEVARHFSAQVEVNHLSNHADGKSIMSMMLLQATRHSEITIRTQGVDEAAAMEALVALVNAKFGEDESV